MKQNSLPFYVCIAAMQVCCCGGLAAQIDISGNIRTESGNNINEVAVTLSGPGVTLYDFSDENGNYQFTGVPENQNYSICLDKDNPLNGVSGLDRLLIRNHVNTTMPFTSPYTIVAADADGDGLVMMRDVYRIRQMILLVYNDFPGVPSWRFVPADYVLDPVNPFPLPAPLQCKEFSAGASNITGVDFIGIKTADVNNSVSTN
jgi:hypothetical protein